MTVIKEIIDGLEAVTKAVDSIQKIVDAVKEGKDYLVTKHPDVRNDLELMVDELHKTIKVVVEASSVLTQFRFAISADTGSSELARFNDYFIKHKSHAETLRNQLNDLRGHCSVIRDHAFNIVRSANASGFASVFTLLGLKSPEREQELGEKLDQLAYEDFEVANSSEIMLECLNRALNDVQNALGVQGAMYPENVPAAAALLAEYAVKFEELERPAKIASGNIQKLLRELK